MYIVTVTTVQVYNGNHKVVIPLTDHPKYSNKTFKRSIKAVRLK